MTERHRVRQEITSDREVEMGKTLFRSAQLLIGVAAAATVNGAAIAAESPIVVGLRGGVETVAASKYSNQPEGTAGDLFVRLFLNRSVAVEAAAGYRSTSYRQAERGTPTSFSMTQVPLTAGAAWVFSPGQTFRPRLGAGIAVLLTKTKATTTLLPNREEAVETSTTVVGGYAEGGAQLPIYENLTADVLFRFVLNPVPLESDRPSSQNYFSALFGLSARF